MPRKPKPAPDANAAWLAGLHPAVRMLAEWEGWEEISGGTLIVACSGGRDSVALAHAAWTLLCDPAQREHFAAYASQHWHDGRPFRLPELVLWHYDHGLRDDSAEDAAFVKALASELGLQAIVDIGRLREDKDYGRMNTAELARVMRYLALDQHIDSHSRWETESTLAKPVCAWLAHHAQDRAETILEHLVRGTGMGGLRGMASAVPMVDGAYRPWLKLSVEHIAAYTQLHDLHWREDPSNALPDRTRSILRHKVLPLLQQLNPSAVEHLTSLGDDVAEFLTEDPTIRLDVFSGSEVKIRLPLLRGLTSQYIALKLPDLPPDSLRMWRAVQGWVIPRCGGLNRRQTSAFRRWLAQGEHQLRLRRTTFWRYGEIVLCDGGPDKVMPELRRNDREPEAATLPLPADHVLLDVIRLEHFDPPLAWSNGLADSLRITDWSEYLAADYQRFEAARALEEEADGTWLHPTLFQPPVYRCALPPGLPEPLVVRSWQAGDRLELPATAGDGPPMHKKLSDIFIDAGIPRVFRRYWMVLADATGRVLWVPGLAISRTVQRCQTEGVAAQLTLHPTEPLRKMWEKGALQRQQLLERTPA
jgi:tRNA(Ile)-lysidine synthetase-like protein